MPEDGNPMIISPPMASGRSRVGGEPLWIHLDVHHTPPSAPMKCVTSRQDLFGGSFLEKGRVRLGSCWIVDEVGPFAADGYRRPEEGVGCPSAVG